MNPYLLGISTFVIMLVVLVVSLIIGLSLVKLLDIGISQGVRLVNVWRPRRATATRA